MEVVVKLVVEVVVVKEVVTGDTGGGGRVSERW